MLWNFGSMSELKNGTDKKLVKLLISLFIRLSSVSIHEKIIGILETKPEDRIPL